LYNICIEYLKRVDFVIDIHCHILPGIDDGASSIEESIFMVKEGYEDGIHTIVATPHHMNGIYNNEKEDILTYVDLLNQRVQQEGLNVTILPGSEIHIYGEFLEDLKSDRLLTFNDKNKYIFLEFPYYRIPENANRLIFEILVSGHIPIIPHPERNKDLQNNPDKLYQFVKQGAITQLTASSLLGLFGMSTQKFSLQIIEHNLAHVIASDSHGIGKRGVKLKEAYQYIKNEFGTSIVNQYQSNAEMIIQGKGIYLDQPYKIKKEKSIFNFFNR